VVEWVVVKPERFAALRRFVKEHGHARVPTEFADDPALGEWVSTQLPRHPRTHAPTHPRTHAPTHPRPRTHELTHPPPVHQPILVAQRKRMGRAGRAMAPRSSAMR
jgi:hypothetical protein